MIPHNTLCSFTQECRPARHPGDARPRTPLHHPALHPALNEASAKRVRPDAPAGEIAVSSLPSALSHNQTCRPERRNWPVKRRSFGVEGPRGLLGLALALEGILAVTSTCRENAALRPS